VRVSRNRNWSGYHAQAAGVYRLIDLEAAQAEHHQYRRHMQYLDHGACCRVDIGKAAGWAQKLSKPILRDITRHARLTARRISPASPLPAR
jgi:hypothetical protein